MFPETYVLLLNGFSTRHDHALDSTRLLSCNSPATLVSRADSLSPRHSRTNNGAMKVNAYIRLNENARKEFGGTFRSNSRRLIFYRWNWRNCCPHKSDAFATCWRCVSRDWRAFFWGSLVCESEPSGWSSRAIVISTLDYFRLFNCSTEY